MKLTASTWLTMSALAMACGSSSTVSSVDGGDVDTATDDASDVVQPPAGCDPNAEPKDAPKCVVNEYGVFVDATSGNDGNNGTKELPLKTIGAALATLGSKPRIYVCEGTYAESVKVTTAASIYGGFTCGAWSYGGAKAKVAPSGRGIALTIANVSSPIVIADVDASSQDAADPGESSIALLVASSTSVTLRRVSAAAGKGMDATDEGPPATNLFSATSADLDGNGATGGTGGPAKPCACKVHGASTGGKGGNGGVPGGNGENGTATPAAAQAPPRTSAGGDGYTNATGQCFVGRPGPDGASRSGGAGATKLGVLSATGWTPEAGTSGEAGNPGSGGGGGGGGDVNGSGGGGCGGCGGAGGAGGKGGGASVGIAVLASTLRLEDVKVTTAAAGKGGSGGTGEAGGGGGAVGACGGGRGGNGAGGGGGGGGAGGVSAGVLRVGGALEGSPQATLGSKGAAGGAGGGGAGGTNALGTAPSGAAASAGVDGQSSAVVEVAP